jgi:hypothetical protein
METKSSSNDTKGSTSCRTPEVKIQKEQQNHLQLGIFEKSQVHETHAQTSFQAPKDLPTHP